MSKSPLAEQMDPRTAGSELIQDLRESPKTGIHNLSPPARVYIRRIKIPKVHAGATSGVINSEPKCVYYLWGDERRAVRRLIDIQTPVFEIAFEDGNTQRLSTSWDESLVQLAREEWDLRNHGGDA